MIRLALALAMFAAPASAQTILRGGEHADFTRLVLPIAPEAAWTLVAEDAGYVLDLGATTPGYDLTRAFARIPRDRVADLTDLGDGRLSLALSCDDCHAGAFLFRGNQLVIDIIDGPPEPRAPYELLVARPETDPPAVADVAPDPGPQPPITADEAFAMTSPLDDYLRATQTSVNIAIDEQALVESIARAATQGLLTPATPMTPPVQTRPPGASQEHLTRAVPHPTDADVLSDPPAMPPPEPVVSTEPDPGAVPMTGAPGIQARTSLDEAFATQVPMAPIETRQSACQPAESFDIASWIAEDEGFAQAISTRRVALTTAIDRVDEDAADDLARAYIHFGFGLEARMILAQDGKQSRQRLLLGEMAAIVDGETPAGAVLSAQAGCGTEGELWALLAGGTDAGSVDRNLVLRAFLQLPRPLKQQLGPTLADQFLAANDLDSAGMILDAAAGRDVLADPDSAVVVENFRDALDEAGLDQGSNLAAVEAPRRPTPQTVLRDLETSLAAGIAPSPELISLAEGFRFEYAGDTLEARLAELEVRAHAARGDFRQALDLAANAATALGPELVRGLRGDVVTMLTEQLDDSSFLDHAYSAIPANLPARVENMLAARLLTLGFPEKAQEFLSGEAVREDASERRYLKAEAAIMLGDGESALTALMGLSDPRAAELRARAYELSGDYRSAMAARGVPPEDPTDPLEAWRAEAWARLATSDDPLLRALSDDMLAADSDQPATPVATLSEARERLDLSGDSRELVDELLLRFELEPAAPGN